MPIGYTHPHSYGTTTDAYAHGNSNSDCYSNGNCYGDGDCDTNTTDNSYADADANRHANPDCDSYRYAKARHTQRAWLQSTGFADGGPLMGRRDLKQH